MGRYFLEVAGGRPTSAASAWHSLKWWQARMGLSGGLDSPLLADFRLAQVGHKPKQTLPLEIRYVAKMVTLACEDAGARSTCSGRLLLLAGACIRFRHAQRTLLEAVDDEFVMGDCRKGKARNNGVRAGFRWCAPRCWGDGRDVLQGVLRQVMSLRRRAEGYAESPFLIPDLQLSGDGVSQDDVWLQVPMGPARLLNVFRMFMESLGMDGTVGHNALRRFLPTGADILDFDEGMSAGIGNWQDTTRPHGSARGR